MPHIPESLFWAPLLGSFNGQEPGGPESMMKKCVWEKEKERKKEGKTQGPKFWWSKGILLAELQAYISLVRWLLSYYTGWNFINSQNMDGLMHTRSLMLKRVTEGSYWKESKQIPFLMISVLRAACSSTHYWNRNWYGTENLWETAHRNPPVKHSLTLSYANSSRKLQRKVNFKTHSIRPPSP